MMNYKGYIGIVEYDVIVPLKNMGANDPASGAYYLEFIIDYQYMGQVPAGYVASEINSFISSLRVTKMSLFAGIN